MAGEAMKLDELPRWFHFWRLGAAPSLGGEAAIDDAIAADLFWPWLPGVRLRDFRSGPVTLGEQESNQRRSPGVEHRERTSPDRSDARQFSVRAGKNTFDLSYDQYREWERAEALSPEAREAKRDLLLKRWKLQPRRPKAQIGCGCLGGIGG